MAARRSRRKLNILTVHNSFWVELGKDNNDLTPSQRIGGKEEEEAEEKGKEKDN